MLKKTSEYEKPDELISAFAVDPDFKKAFDELTPVGKEDTCFIFREPNNPKHGKRELKNTISTF